jgi:4-carboxymuconolactone decarboxylase
VTDPAPDSDSARRARGIAMYAQQFGVPADELPAHMARMLGPAMAEQAQYASADAWTDASLSMRDRSLAVIAALVAQGGVEARLRGHLRWAPSNGVTREELDALMVLLAGYVGYPKASIAMELLIEELGPLSPTDPQEPS